MAENTANRLANHFYEAGNLKRMLRTGQRSYFEADPSDSVAGHTYRVAVIAWHLGSLTNDIDPNRLAAMAVFHDFGENRSGDSDWTMKRYVSIDEESLQQDWIRDLDNRLEKLVKEYEDRETKADKIVKDADVIEFILTLSELAQKGNKEAKIWLEGRSESSNKYNQLKYLHTDIAKEIAKEIYETEPGEWRQGVWTNGNE